MNKTRISGYIQIILPALLLAALIIFSKDYLLQVESRSLFLYDWFWIKDFLKTPAGPLSCLSLFLTQFLHLPWLGALIWVLLLTLSAIATSRLYIKGSGYDALAYIPSFILAGANMSLGYLMFIMNTLGYFFGPVLGYLSVILAVTICRKIRTTPGLGLFTAIWGIAGYWFAGYYAFAGLIAAASDILLSKHDKKDKAVFAVISVAVIILSPLLLYGLTTYNLQQSWTLGLPTALYEETHFRTFCPVIAATLIPVILPFLDRMTGRPSKRPALIQTAILVPCIVLLFLSWFKDVNFNAELSMIQATDDLDWNKSINTLQDLNSRADRKKDYQPTRVMVLLKDLALIKTGRESQQAFAFDDGSMKQKESHDIPMVLQIGKELYLHYGIPGFCHRWCLEETGEFGWSYSRLKYLTMASISMNDRTVALKYLDMLNHTLFYRKWSKQQRLICNGNVQAEKTAPYDLIIPLVCYKDQLWEDIRGCEYALSHHFLETSSEKATPLYDRVALFWALKSQNATAFWTKFLLYIESSDISKLDRYYQEAAYLYSHIGNNKTLMSLPYDNNTRELYDSFMATVQKHGTDIENLNDARRIFPVRLRNTYYYYYFFVRGLESF